MAANQYSYPPPPPPPSQSGPPAGYPQYQQHPYGGNPPHRGGGRGRGRGGNHNQGGRGDFHASSQYNHHAGGYNGPAPVAGGYVQQNPAPYIGPQPPASLPPNGYPGPQWQEQQQQHHGLQHHHQPQQVHQPPAPIPLSAQNYHPNYAPQVYNQSQPQQPPQYGPQQPFQHSPPQNSYPQHLPPSQPPHPSGPPHPQQQWQGQPHQVQPPFNNGGRGRGRGNGPSRGGYEAPLMGPPIRMGFGDDRSVDPMPQASNGYPPPFANPQHSSAIPFSQPAYQNYPQHNFSQRGRPPLDPNPFYSQNSYRGRGGFQQRGKRDLSTGDKMRHRTLNKNRHSNGSLFQGSVTDLPQKPAVEDGDKVGEGKKKKKKKRKTNTLGLTPRTEEHEESEEEDDADEESRLAAAVENADREPSNLAAWLAERRRKWPTKARRDAKEAELAKRQAQSAEQSARAKSKAKKENDEREALEVTRSKRGSDKGESKLQKQQKRAEKLRKQLERAEKKLQDAMNAGTKRKRDARDEGDEDGEVNQSSGDGVDGDHVDQVIAQATAGASAMDLESDSDTSGSSEYISGTDSDDDSPPEAHTARSNGPVRVFPPKKTILQRQCKYFSTGGTCGKKGKCRFVHDQYVRDAALIEKEMNGGRMTLAQRLVQNDKEKDDLLILKSIKHLYEKGLLTEPQAASALYDDSAEDGFRQENFKPEREFENGSPLESFDTTSQPEVHENMIYGED